MLLKRLSGSVSAIRVNAPPLPVKTACRPFVRLAPKDTVPLSFM
jgi:hypothetical protein